MNSLITDGKKQIINCFECSYRCKDNSRVRFIMTTQMKYPEVENLLQRYEDYAWLLLQLEKDTEVFNLTHNTRDWTFEDWRVFYLKKAKEDKQ